MKVGQTVWLKPEGNYSRNCDVKIIETTILSIGRKYGKLNIDNGLNPLFDLEDYYEKNDSSPNYHVYFDKEEAENPMRRGNKQRDIIDLMSKMNYKQLCNLEDYIKAKPFL